MKPKHVKLSILSRGPNLYSTLRLAYEARKIGWRVRVINPLSVSLHLTQKPVYYVDQKPHEPHLVIARIGNSITQQGVSVVRHVSLSGIPVINQPDAILRSRNKLEAHQVLVANGLAMPATVYVSGSFNVEELLQTLGPPPWIIKVVSGTQGVGVLMAKTLKEAESLLEFAAANKQPVLVQQFIAEAKGADIRALVVGNEVVAAMKRQAPEGDFRSNLHRGGSAKRYRLSNLEKAIAVRAAKALGLEVAGVDMLLSERGPLLMEVNSSPGLEGIENNTGVNVANRIIDYANKLLNESWASRVLAAHDKPIQTTTPTVVTQAAVAATVAAVTATNSTAVTALSEQATSKPLTQNKELTKKKKKASFSTPSSIDEVATVVATQTPVPPKGLNSNKKKLKPSLVEAKPLAKPKKKRKKVVEATTSESVVDVNVSEQQPQQDPKTTELEQGHVEAGVVGPLTTNPVAVKPRGKTSTRKPKPLKAESLVETGSTAKQEETVSTASTETTETSV